MGKQSLHSHEEAGKHLDHMGPECHICREQDKQRSTQIRAQPRFKNLVAMKPHRITPLLSKLPSLYVKKHLLHRVTGEAMK